MSTAVANGRVHGSCGKLAQNSVAATALPCDLFVAWSAGRIAGLLRRQPIWLKLQNFLSGTILIGLGGAMALARRQ